MPTGRQAKTNDYYQRPGCCKMVLKMTPFNTSLRMRLGDVEGSLQKYIRSGSQIGAGIVSLKCAYAINRENWDLCRHMPAIEIFLKKQAIMKGGQRPATIATLLNKQDRMKEAIALIDKVKRTNLQPDLQWQAGFTRKELPTRLWGF